MSLKNRIIGLAAIGAASLALAPAAQAACTDPTTQVFAPWGDNAFYALAGGGSFEAGAPGWTLSGGAKIVRDLDNGLASDGAADEYALELGPDAVAISPPICVTKDSAQFRFLANVLVGTTKTANTQVVVRYQGKDNKSFDLTSPAGRSVPLGAISLASGQFQDGTTVSLKFRSLAKATVRVDDVYMDPRMH
jgi:hypothetical protein